jgi:hypothetical protein
MLQQHREKETRWLYTIIMRIKRRRRRRRGRALGYY